MKEKKHKYLEDLFDEHICLSDEQLEIPLLIEKAQKKFDQLISPQKDTTYKYSDAEDLFKYHNQIRKHEDRKKEVSDELAEVESLLKEFLTSLNRAKISFEKKDDNDRSKNTYLFWLEGDQVKTNR